MAIQSHVTPRVVVALVDPTGTDTDYEVGAVWINETDDRVWAMVDPDRGGSAVWVRLTPEATIKSGVISSVADGSSGIVLYTSSFSSPPRVVLTFLSSDPGVDIPVINVTATSGFSWTIHKGHGGVSHVWTLFWIATDAES